MRIPSRLTSLLEVRLEVRSALRAIMLHAKYPQMQEFFNGVFPHGRPEAAPKSLIPAKASTTRPSTTTVGTVNSLTHNHIAEFAPFSTQIWRVMKFQSCYLGEKFERTVHVCVDQRRLVWESASMSWSYLLYE